MNEREQFEAFASGAGKWPKAIERDSKGEYRLAQTASDWRVWQARAALAASPAPAGYKLVPVEPTPEMLAAWPAHRHGAGHEAAIYRAMLAAAPTTPNGLTESEMPAQQNQCDGCMAGMPLERGFHRDKDGRPVQSCERSRYEAAPAQQAEAYQPEFLERVRLLAGRLRGTDWCKPDLRYAATLLEEFYLTATAAPAPSVEAQADEARQALETAANELSERLSKIGGCTDGGCQVVTPKGMHTNGGCKCLSDHLTARRVVHAYQAFAKRLAALKEPQR